MITKQIAMSLHHGQVLHHVYVKNADGSALRCRVNGKCKIWATREDDFRLPVKHGLRDCFYIDNSNADQWEVPIVCVGDCRASFGIDTRGEA